MKACTGRDLEQCDTCQHNIENHRPGWGMYGTLMRPLLNADETECADHMPMPISIDWSVERD